ncbi:uncharacterized protein LOC143246379 isoform X2 [Tachypleus tridentatus]|uniref:uncharacterized protein LOC143246379 isoform X2 n=1 Tax=Tachypleus tridentatus TaxID=6853 RepID=UPI003FD3635E
MVGRRRNNKKQQGGKADAPKKGTSTAQASSQEHLDVSSVMMDDLDLSDIKETEDIFAEEMDKELSLAIADIFDNEYGDELADIISESDEPEFVDTKNITTDTSLPSADSYTKSKETNQTKKKLDDKPSVCSTQPVVDKEITESMVTKCNNSEEEISRVPHSVNTEESESSRLDLFPKISVTEVEKIKKVDSLTSQVIDREQEDKLSHCEEPFLVNPDSSVEARLSFEEIIQDNSKTASQEPLVENSDSVSEALLSMSVSIEIDKSLSNTSLVLSTTNSVEIKSLENILETNVSESNPDIMEGDHFEEKVKSSSDDFQNDKCNVIDSLEGLEAPEERSDSIDVKSVETSEKHSMNEKFSESGTENQDEIKAVSNAETEGKNDTVFTEMIKQASGNQLDKELTSMNDEESIVELELGDDELAELIEKELTEIVKNDSVEELCKESDSKSAQLLQEKKYEETKLNGLFRGHCHLENELKKILSPLIGLEYVVEVWQHKWEKFKYFECVLCKQKLDDITLVQHLTDSLHRVLYLLTLFC